MSNIKRYILVGILPIIILVSMTITPLNTYLNGVEIVIETMPYDPRDVFRGDHVVLNYKINEVDLDKLPAEFRNIDDINWHTMRNKKLYTVLVKKGDFYEVDYVTFEKPKNKLFLNARYQYPIWNYEDTKDKPELKGAFLSYNLDKYFVPENTGRRLEDLSVRGKLKAKVKVLNGYSLLVDIF
ncbi:GDYXXLXY domain-containing protein [Alkalithermobacter paradoxus]|uniref:GDYXXLXY protein n=1 Tax=Alkalithermobacter paradoxus TaxID=29349 RepID=A0A1V4I5T1_9FIRM|nr:hypothetical protein CLOTH_18920 [[Clostridium] thermoalcaliphilum]